MGLEASAVVVVALGPSLPEITCLLNRRCVLRKILVCASGVTTQRDSVFRPPPTNTVVVFIVFTMVYHSAASMLLLLSSLVLTAMIRLEARDLCVPTSNVITNYFEGKRPPTCHYNMFYASVPSLF